MSSPIRIRRVSPRRLSARPRPVEPTQRRSDGIKQPKPSSPSPGVLGRINMAHPTGTKLIEFAIKMELVDADEHTALKG